MSTTTSAERFMWRSNRCADWETRSFFLRLTYTPTRFFSTSARSRLKGSELAELESIAATLCLAVPIASSRPLEVKKILTDLKNRGVPTYVTRLVDESLQVIGKRCWRVSKMGRAGSRGGHCELTEQEMLQRFAGVGIRHGDNNLR